MKKIFRTEAGEVVDELIHTSEITSRELKNDLKIYIGCDSQNRRYNTSYVTVIAYRYGTRGAHFIYYRDNVKKIRDRWQRLWGEVTRSTELALEMEKSGFKVFRVDLDFNEKEIARSSDMVAAARGFVVGHGFACEVKPGMLIASKAADHMVRK